MHDPLHRLYRTKLALLATVLLATGLGLLILGHALARGFGWPWLAKLPILDIGSALFTTGLLGVAIQYVDGQDSEERDTDRLQRVLAASAPAMRDAVIAGFAFEPQDLARVATTEVLDRIVTNGLAIRLGDETFAAEVYGDLQRQAVAIPERLHDLRISVRLSPLTGTKPTPPAVLNVTIRYEFSLIPHFPTRRFSCVSDIDDLRDLADNPGGDTIWVNSPRVGKPASALETFELLDFTVDGASRSIRRTTRQHGQTYTVNLGLEPSRHGEPVSIAYTYRALVPVDGHLLQLRVDQPARGLSIDFDYSDCGFDRVSVLDFIASHQATRVAASPKSVPGRSLAVEFDGWVLPRSGVAFVWSDWTKAD
jgi:hypothetical protein